MKKLSINATIVSFTRLAQPTINGSTHRLTIAKSNSVDKAIESAKLIKRTDDKKASFCLVKDNGDCVIDLKLPQALALAASSGCELHQLPLVAEGSNFKGNVEMREIGQIVLDRKTGEEKPIEQGHAGLTDISFSLSYENKRMMIAESFNQNVSPVANVATQQPIVAETNGTKEDVASASNTQI